MGKKTNIYIIIISTLFFLAYVSFNSIGLYKNNSLLIQQGYTAAMNDFYKLGLESGKQCKPMNINKDLQLINVKCLQQVTKSVEKTVMDEK